MHPLRGTLSVLVWRAETHTPTPSARPSEGGCMWRRTFTEVTEEGEAVCWALVPRDKREEPQTRTEERPSETRAGAGGDRTSQS